MTLAQFIASLGGTSAAARIFAVRPSAVSNWLADGKLPPKRHYRAHRLAEERGWTFNPERASNGSLKKHKRN